MLRSRSRTLSTNSRHLRGSFNSLVHLGSPFEQRSLPQNPSRSAVQDPATPQQPSCISNSPSQPKSDDFSNISTPPSIVHRVQDSDMDGSLSFREERVPRLVRLLQSTPSEHSSPIFNSGFLLDPENNGRDTAREAPDRGRQLPARTPETHLSPPRAQPPLQRNFSPLRSTPGRSTSSS